MFCRIIAKSPVGSPDLTQLLDFQRNNSDRCTVRQRTTQQGYTGPNWSFYPLLNPFVSRRKLARNYFVIDSAKNKPIVINRLGNSEQLAGFRANGKHRFIQNGWLFLRIQRLQQCLYQQLCIAIRIELFADVRHQIQGIAFGDF